MRYIPYYEDIIKRKIDRAIVKTLEKFNEYCQIEWFDRINKNKKPKLSGRFLSKFDKEIMMMEGLSCSELRYLLLKKPQIKKGMDYKSTAKLKVFKDNLNQKEFNIDNKYFRNRLHDLKIRGFIVYIKKKGKYGKYRISEKSHRYRGKEFDMSNLKGCDPMDIEITMGISYYYADHLPKKLKKEIEPILLDVESKIYNGLWNWEDKGKEELKKMSDEELKKEIQKELTTHDRIYKKHKYPDPIIVININQSIHLPAALRERENRLIKKGL